MPEVPSHRVTPEEYLAFERASETKHEYVDGYIVAMSGARRAHDLISWNIAASLHAQFRGRPCEAHTSDFRVKISEAGMYAYPDVTALCGKAELEDDQLDTLLNPHVIFEVISPSTEWYTRGKKREYYQKRASLNEYLLVAQDRAHVERYTRNGGAWDRDEIVGLDATIVLPSIDATLLMSDIYERVAPFEPPSSRPLRRVKEQPA